jgi:RNA polymerase sigma factor (sigma-70 family)
MHQPRRIAEEELISHCKTGGLKYQELLYKQFYGYAMGVSLRYSLNRDDALEVVNDAFIKIFKAIPNFQSDKPFKAWLRTIVVNTAIDRRRKELKFQLHVEVDDTMLVSGGATAVENLGAHDILKLMMQLPSIQHTIFNLYEVDGYNHDEIASMLSIPSSSSRVYLSRAKEKLRTLLKTEDQNNGRAVR